MKEESVPGLKFGIYLGGVVETAHELATGKPDIPDEINRSLNLLQSARSFLVRTYLRFTGTANDARLVGLPTVSDLARYTWRGRKLDLVLSNWDSRGNLNGWSEFIENAITRYGPYAGCIQICEEPNLYDYPGDGRFGHAVDFVISGVKTARRKIRDLRLSPAIGFNAVPSFDRKDGFWRALGAQADDVFLNALDYAGINFYPDVSDPLAGSMSKTVSETLTQFREVNLLEARIPASTPIHICESGWPTGPYRYYTRQAEMLEQTIQTVFELREKLNITHFELFALRDADTANPHPYSQFGILRDDYSPKPAFETYRRLITELGR